MAKATGSNTGLKNQLESKSRGNGEPAKQGDRASTVMAYLKKMKPQMAMTLPRHMTADRLARIALTVIRTTPKLLNCRMESLMGAVMQAAQLGLEPGLIGHCYIIPFGEEATFIIGYRGMIDLARRSGHIESIYAHAVYENDEFDYEYGLSPDLKHRPADDDRGAFMGAYAVAHFKDGGYQFEFMPEAEIEKRRARSKAGRSGPWVSDYEEMAKKTVIRHMFKYLPISIEDMRAVEMEGATRTAGEVIDDPDGEDIIDGQALEVPEDAAGNQEQEIELAKTRAAYFAAMAEKLNARGDDAKDFIKQMYQVPSFKDLALQQIQSVVDQLHDDDGVAQVVTDYAAWKEGA